MRKIILCVCVCFFSQKNHVKFCIAKFIWTPFKNFFSLMLIKWDWLVKIYLILQTFWVHALWIIWKSPPTFWSELNYCLSLGKANMLVMCGIFTSVLFLSYSIGNINHFQACNCYFVLMAKLLAFIPDLSLEYQI